MKIAIALSITAITIILLALTPIAITGLVQDAYAHHRPGHAGGPPDRGGPNGDETVSIDLLLCDDGPIAKWADAEVTYSITGNFPGLKDYVIPAVQEGVQEWEITEGANPVSPYDLMHVTSNADVTIRIVKTIAPGTILGFAAVDCQDTGSIQSVEIVIGVKALKEDGVRNLAAHEFGHALGLGHSDKNNDLMGPSLDQKERKNLLCVSNLDIQALSQTETPYSISLEEWTQLAC